MRFPVRLRYFVCVFQFQSHQLFHLFVVVAAFVHFHGITEMVMRRLEQGSCAEQLLEQYGVEHTPSYVGQWFPFLDEWVHSH